MHERILVVGVMGTLVADDVVFCKVEGCLPRGSAPPEPLQGAMAEACIPLFQVVGLHALTHVHVSLSPSNYLEVQWDKRAVCQYGFRIWPAKEYGF